MEMGGLSNALDVSALREEKKFSRASNVNVSNFVSVKLSDRISYELWKVQMLCLIKSQVLFYIIDHGTENPSSPGDDMNNHMIAQYDQLVKGWIFGTMANHVLNNYADCDSARKVWAELESCFGSQMAKMNGECPYDVPDSELRGQLRYTLASKVNVSDFVTEKLSNEDNLLVWKAEMLRLIESHGLLYILDKFQMVGTDDNLMAQKCNKLVKGWILGSMSGRVLIDFTGFDKASHIWSYLDIYFRRGSTSTEGAREMEMGGLSNALDVSAPSEELKFSLASNINVSNFVSVKLSDRSSYRLWKIQILCLIKSQTLFHIIDHGTGNPSSRGDDMNNHMIAQYDQLVKGWIFGTMANHVLNNYADCDSARKVWMELESCFGSDMANINGNCPYDVPDSELREQLRYMLASKVNVSDFVTEKLSNEDNLLVWKAEMLRLIESHRLLYILDKFQMDGTDDNPMAQKYNKLVKGWILGSMSGGVLTDFTVYDKATYIWLYLDGYFRRRRTRTEGTKLITFRREFENVPEIEDTDNIILKKELYKAASEGCWWKAKSILKTHKDAAIMAITTDGNTILHLAVEMGHDYFVEKLLDFLKDEEEEGIAKGNNEGRTALHIAAMVGNECAAQLLIKKNNDLLVIRDNTGRLPWNMSETRAKMNTIVCLFKSALSYGSLLSTLEGHRIQAIKAAILTKQYDLAWTLIEKHPGIGFLGGLYLKGITLSFPTDLGFMESFIYPSFYDVYQNTIIRGSLLFHSNFLDKYVDDISKVVKFCNHMCWSWLGKCSLLLLVPIATLNPIFQMIYLVILVLHLPFSTLYFLLWKVLAVVVHPIKNIEHKRRDYQGAKQILSFLCDNMGTSNEDYDRVMLEAVRNDVYQVVDEILFMSPTTINCKNDEGHDIIQLSILNRSEKVYNLIHHIIERRDSYDIKDSSKNSLLHLAGRLAPSIVLGRTTGAALQLQRELLWYEEVKKLFLPLQLLHKNIYDETPAMVFTREHIDLMKQGEAWMKTTAESCSITAALIVTVVFAAAITVPGGNNQESGIPVFRKETAFTVFAVSNAFSLFTATTSLLMFLSVLTARFSEKDFLVSLPRRLILGLLTLFLSTTSMMVAFGAILFLVFCDQRPWMLAPILAFSCLPLSVIVTVKVPLLADLIKSTYFPIFGNKTYLKSCKVNRKSTKVNLVELNSGEE